jgi:Cft2 family RNA processing exonuclease
MQVVFLGGASGVGASCLAVQSAGQWFVVDAGVRVDRNADPLPDLAFLEDKAVKAIFVTHAHSDHIGALPLLFQAFPRVPIFASRATALLMEVMLADAVKIMARRAMEEMELPLYPEKLVRGMLDQVRTLPVGEPFSVSELPGVTISASRAGHIAGAVSLSFVAAGGSLVVSGDLSMTPQRTVQGAATPSVSHPDLLVLESTYGSRLHPNRQNEELRLAQAVAEGLKNGGHVLIPCFGLGRGQEILLLLQAAQEQGQIPDFPIYVDGLVRRVCDTYLLMPEALAPRLQRQIRRGFQPFRGPNVTFVRDERERERILAGPPSCIVSSSGMLTGGPSAWYAARLAANPDASILITGYQDEESPGKRLLDVAEHKQDTLELGGQTVKVQCHVSKYSLSAHADGGELASYAAALAPKQVALVHGDPEARASLRELISETDVLLPVEGVSITAQRTQKSGTQGKQVNVALAEVPRCLGNGAPFEYDDIEQLWQAVKDVPDMRIVTVRELALIWYGEATEETTRAILDALDYDYEQRYFVRQHALEEAFRVRGTIEESSGDVLSDLVGNILLLAISLESAKPVVCRAIEPGAAVRVYLPRGISQERTRFPLSSILEILGPVPPDIQQNPRGAPLYLNELVKASRRIRRNISAQDLARQCQEGALYTLSELCMMANVSAHSLEERLALAKVLHKNPTLFTQERSVFDGEGLTLYGLSPEWQEAMKKPEELERPDQNWILSVIDLYLGSPDDLYRRSVDPDTGAVTLSFHFPAIAQERYAAALAAAAEETGVSISIAPQAHQGELARAALRVLPAGLTVLGSPSIYHGRDVIALNCAGQAPETELAEAQSQFHEETGWYLEFGINGKTLAPPNLFAPPDQFAPAPDVYDSILEDSEEDDKGAIAAAPRRAPINQHDAMVAAQRMLGRLAGFTKVGADPASSRLLPRFQFPLVAEKRYAAAFKQLETETGWMVQVQPTTNQQALVEMAYRLLPQGLTCPGMPSLLLNHEIVSVRCLGEAGTEAIQEAQRQFLEETGWQLELLLPGQDKSVERPQRMPQEKALALIRATLRDKTDFYRTGADASRGILWVHFHFPDAVRQYYLETLAQLSSQTGWRVYIYPHAHQSALKDAIARLLPDGVSLSGQPSIQEHVRKMGIHCSAEIDRQTIKHIQERFTQETGWQIEIS